MNFSSASDGVPGLSNKSRMLIKKRAAPKIFDKRLNPPTKPSTVPPRSVNDCSKVDAVENVEKTIKISSGLKSHDSEPVIGCPIERTVSDHCDLSLPVNESTISGVIVEGSGDPEFQEKESCASIGTLDVIGLESSSSTSVITDGFQVKSVSDSPGETEQTTSNNENFLSHDPKPKKDSITAEEACQDETPGDTELSQSVDGGEVSLSRSETEVMLGRTKCSESSGVSNCENTSNINEVSISPEEDDDKICDDSDNNRGGQITKDSDVTKIRKHRNNSLPPKKRAVRNIEARNSKKRQEDMCSEENEEMEKAFAHCGLRKRKRKKKVSCEKMSVKRKKSNIKLIVNDQNKEKLSLRDYIFYVPDSEPMKEELIKPEVSLNASDHEEEDNVDEPEEIEHGPKLIIRDGEIIVDPQSTMIKRSIPSVYKDIKVERFKQRREASETWTLKDTVRFYYTLWQYGIDFSLISSSFASKSRHAVKNKFNLERRNNSAIVSKVLAKKSDDDEESFKSIMKELIVRCSKIAKKKKVKAQVPSVITSHHFDGKSKKKSAKANLDSSRETRHDKIEFLRKFVNSDDNEDDDDDDDDTIIASDLDESALNNLVNITFSTNMVYQDMNIVESVSIDPTACNPIDVNVTISHDDEKVIPPEDAMKS